MKLYCVSCARPIANEDRRRKQGSRLKPIGAVRLENEERRAPRLHCPCGHVTIILKGQV